MDFTILTGGELLHQDSSPAQLSPPVTCLIFRPSHLDMPRDPLSQNHRMARAGRDLKDHEAPTPHHRQGHQPPHVIPAHAAQGPIQPGLEHLQGWTGHPQPLWAAVPAPHHSHSKELPLTSNLNLPSFNLKPFPLALLLSTLSCILSARQ